MDWAVAVYLISDRSDDDKHLFFHYALAQSFTWHLASVIVQLRREQ